MTYCTIDQYAINVPQGYQELLQLTDRHNNGHIDQSVFDNAIAVATQEIHEILHSKFADSLPFDPVPETITKLTVDIARRHLHGDKVPEIVQSNYEMAINRLKEIRDGKRELDTGDTIQEPANQPRVMFTSEPQRFTRSRMMDY